ncbi:MAG: hypothetical protein H5T95_08480 [Firmicutes bacterium]|nr:hypothetical protein [Bacillota bacterium]
MRGVKRVSIVAAAIVFVLASYCVPALAKDMTCMDGPAGAAPAGAAVADRTLSGSTLAGSRLAGAASVGAAIASAAVANAGIVGAAIAEATIAEATIADATIVDATIVDVDATTADIATADATVGGAATADATITDAATVDAMIAHGAIVVAAAGGGGPGTEAEAPSQVASDAAVAAPSESSAPQDVQVPETYAELKALYLKALERIVELEAALQEALDLARGYRSDWAEERAIAEARKAQTEQALEMAKTLQDLIREMKDIINKQHETIMRLTATKPTSIGFTAGVSLQRTALAPDRFSYQPGFTVGIIVFP